MQLVCIDTIHGMGDRILILYIRVPPSHAFPVYIWQLEISDLHAAFTFILAPETLAL
jgi:hypothetical protein